MGDKSDTKLCIWHHWMNLCFDEMTASAAQRQLGEKSVISRSNGSVLGLDILILWYDYTNINTQNTLVTPSLHRPLRSLSQFTVTAGYSPGQPRPEAERSHASHAEPSLRVRRLHPPAVQPRASASSRLRRRYKPV